jgi:hypothetical protein
MKCVPQIDEDQNLSKITALVDTACGPEDEEIPRE